MQPLAHLTQRLLPWALAVLLVVTVGGPPASAQAPSPRMLTVTGNGQDYAPATLAQVTLGIVDQGDSAKATYDAVTQDSSAVVKLLKTNKATDIKTSNIHLDPQYGRDGKPAKATYDGHQTVKFQLPVSKIAVLDQVLVADVDNLQGISYRASDAALVTARDQALENAIFDAQGQAKVALKQLGFDMQEVVDIQIDDAQVNKPDSQPAPVDKSYSGRWSDGLPVAGGEQAVQVQVTLQIRY